MDSPFLWLLAFASSRIGATGGLLLRGDFDLRDREGVSLGRSGDDHLVTRVRLQRCEILVGDREDLVPLADEHVLLASLDASFDALAIGHLFGAVFAIFVHRLAHPIADPTFESVRQQRRRREQREGRDTRQGLPHTQNLLNKSRQSTTERITNHSSPNHSSSNPRLPDPDHGSRSRTPAPDPGPRVPKHSAIQYYPLYPSSTLGRTRVIEGNAATSARPIRRAIR